MRGAILLHPFNPDGVSGTNKIVHPKAKGFSTGSAGLLNDSPEERNRLIDEAFEVDFLNKYFQKIQNSR